MLKRTTIDEPGGSSLDAPVGRGETTQTWEAALHRALNQRTDASALARKRAQFALLLVLVAVGVWSLITLRAGHLWGDDFSLYIQHAKNIVTGMEYHHTEYILNPRQLLGPTSYPPVFPLLLAPVYWWFGLNLTAMKVELVLIFVCALWAIYLALREELAWPHLIALVAMVGFNPYIWRFKENILSDLPFLLFVYLSLFLMRRAYSEERTETARRFDAVWIGLTVYLAYGTRSIGLILLPCLLAYDLVKNRRTTAVALKSIGVAALLVLLQTYFSHSDKEYAGLVGVKPKVAGIAWGNLQDYTDYLSAFWANGHSQSLQSALITLLAGLAIIGYGSRWRQRAQITCLEFFPIFYLGPFLLMPLTTDPRYLIPVLPLFLFYALLGLRLIADKRPWESVAFAMMVMAVALAYFAQYGRLDYGPLTEGIGKRETQQLFAYVQQETAAQDIFIFRKPRAFSLFTGRPASIWSVTDDDQEQWDYFRQIKATHIVLDAQDCLAPEPRYFCKFVARHQDRLQETFTNADFHVYRIKDKARLQAKATDAEEPAVVGMLMDVRHNKR